MERSRLKRYRVNSQLPFHLVTFFLQTRHPFLIQRFTHFENVPSERRVVFLVRMVRLQHPLRPRYTKENTNVHESRGHEWRSSLSRSTDAEGRVQSLLSR